MLRDRTITNLSLCLIACCLSACSDTTTQSPSKPAGDATAAKPPEEVAPPPKTAKEKLIGKWDVVLSFSNDKLAAAHEKLTDQAAKDELNTQVENLMGSTMKFEFAEDGTVKTNMPVKGEPQDLEGTWTLKDDTNDTAKVMMVFKSGEEDLKRDAKITFETDDHFKAPFNPIPDPAAQGIFYLDVRRNKLGKK